MRQRGAGIIEDAYEVSKISDNSDSNNESFFYGLIERDLCYILFIMLIIVVSHIGIIFIGIGYENLPGLESPEYIQYIELENHTQSLAEYDINYTEYVREELKDNLIYEVDNNNFNEDESSHLSKLNILADENACVNFYDYICESNIDGFDKPNDNWFRDIQISNKVNVERILSEPNNSTSAATNSYINVSYFNKMCIDFFDDRLYTRDNQFNEDNNEGVILNKSSILQDIVNEIISYRNVNTIGEYIQSILILLNKWDLYSIIDLSIEINPVNSKQTIFYLQVPDADYDSLELDILEYVYNEYYSDKYFHNTPWRTENLTNKLSSVKQIQHGIINALKNRDSSKKEYFNIVNYLRHIKDYGSGFTHVNDLQAKLDLSLFDVKKFIGEFMGSKVNWEINTTYNDTTNTAKRNKEIIDNSILWVHDEESIISVVNMFTQYQKLEWESYFIFTSLLSVESLSNYKSIDEYTYHHGYDPYITLPWNRPTKLEYYHPKWNSNFSQDSTTSAQLINHCMDKTQLFMVSDINDLLIEDYIRRGIFDKNTYDIISDIFDVMKLKIIDLFPFKKSKVENIQMIISGFINSLSSISNNKRIDKSDITIVNNYIDCIFVIRNYKKFDLNNKLIEYSVGNNNLPAPLLNEMIECDISSVNAFYHHQLNTVIISPGILQYPFMLNNCSSENNCHYYNLAKIGTIIAHELSHSIDEFGNEFGSLGIYGYKDIENIDYSKLSVITDESLTCIENMYTGRTIYGNINNGASTLNENLADIIGFYTSFNVLSDTIGINSDTYNSDKLYKEFFANYASLWCQHNNPDVDYYITQKGVHSTPSYRVNSIIEEFRCMFDSVFRCNNDDVRLLDHCTYTCPLGI